MRTQLNLTLLSAAFLFALGSIFWTMHNGYAAAPQPQIPNAEGVLKETEKIPAIERGFSNRVIASESSIGEKITDEEHTLHTLLMRAAKYQQQFSDVATQPGWTFMAYTQTDFLPSTSPKPLPATHRRTTWSYFNQYRQVEREIEFFETDKTGLTLLGYLQDGVRESVWHNDRSDEQPFTPAYDFYFVKTLQALEREQREFSLHAQYVTQADQSLEQFVLVVPLSAHETQWVPDKLNQEVLAIVETFWFDTQTGALVRYTYDYQLADGTIVPVTKIDQIEIRANVEIPREILSQLP